MTPNDINTCKHEWLEGLNLGIVDLNEPATNTFLGAAYRVQACKWCLVMRLRPRDSA